MSRKCIEANDGHICCFGDERLPEKARIIVLKDDGTWYYKDTPQVPEGGTTHA